MSDPQGRFLFIPNELVSICCPDFGESAFSVDSSTGKVNASAIALLNEGHFAFHTSGKFLYIASTFAEFIFQFSYHGVAGVDLSTSSLASIPGSPFSNGQYMGSVSVEPTGHYLYTSGLLNPNSSTPTSAFETYSVDSTTGTLTLISTDTSPAVQPSGTIVFHPSGKFGYALNTRSGSQVVDLYSVNATTGALTFISTQVNGDLLNPRMHPSGNFLYGCVAGVPGQPCQPVGYRVDSNTGALTAIPGFSLDPVAGSSLDIDKSGQHAYALGGSFGQPSSQIFVYSIDSSTGLISQIPNLTATVPAEILSIAAAR
jgi:6-phosphogluconolactonase (cycloisomerase 2 family)